MLPHLPKTSRFYDRLDSTGSGVALKIGLTTRVSKALRAASWSRLALRFTVDKDAVSIVDNADALVGREHNVPRAWGRDGTRETTTKARFGREKRIRGTRYKPRGKIQQTSLRRCGFATADTTRSRELTPGHCMRCDYAAGANPPRHANPTTSERERATPPSSRATPPTRRETPRRRPTLVIFRGDFPVFEASSRSTASPSVSRWMFPIVIPHVMNWCVRTCFDCHRCIDIRKKTMIDWKKERGGILDRWKTTLERKLRNIQYIEFSSSIWDCCVYNIEYHVLKKYLAR